MPDRPVILPGDGGDADLGWLASTPVKEDSGAQTQSRYRYQHECTARACVPLFLREKVLLVVCEEQEDFVVFHLDAPPELVSVKHREASQGPWSFEALVTDGGVAHLFDRWLATGRRATCRVMTNGGLKTGAQQARQFADACHSGDRRRIEPWIKKLASKLGLKGPEAESDPTAFAAVLSVESDLPSREHIGAVNLRELVIPMVERRGLAVQAAERCYERLLDHIARCNRGAVGDRVDVIEVAGDPRRLVAAVAADRRLRRRAIDYNDAATILLEPSPESAPRLGSPSGDPPPSPSRLQRKLERGGLGPTVVSSAVRLRAAWYGFEKQRRLNLPGGDESFEDLRARVHELVGLSESRQDRSKSYGTSMHLDVRKTVTLEALNTAQPFPLDDQLLQGLVFQLTDECSVWWSDLFDIDAA